jgi:hypothetical protein
VLIAGVKEMMTVHKNILDAITVQIAGVKEMMTVHKNGCESAGANVHQTQVQRERCRPKCLYIFFVLAARHRD